MNKFKTSWLIGLVLGVAFGLIITYAHEHIYQLANYLNLNTSAGIPNQLVLYSSVVQKLYDFSFVPFFFMGLAILVFQYFLPPITYGFIGLLAGWLYERIKNRSNAPIFTFSKRFVIVALVILIVIVSFGMYIKQLYYSNEFHVSLQSGQSQSDFNQMTVTKTQ